MKKIHFLLSAILMVLLINFSCTESSKERIWSFEFEDVAFDSVKVNFIGQSAQEIYFKKENDTWKINVPDSIYKDYTLLELSGFQPEKDWLNIAIVDSPKVVKYNVSNILLFSDEKPVKVKASLLQALDNALFFTSDYSDTEYLNAKKMASLYSQLTRGEVSIEEATNNIFEYIESTPNSLAIMKYLVQFYYSLDLETSKKLLATLDDDAKNTRHGKALASYIEDMEAFKSTNKFQVFDLPRCDNPENIEPFVKDDGKYKLIIFSSVGCGPCHAAIPIYKEVYNDLSNKLDMLYISIDRSDLIEKWNEILVKYEIPWRSYFSYNIESGILQKYMLYSVPSSFLVYPDFTFEKIDIRKQEDKDKLYKLIRNS